ncbi:MAG TPA: hypothetical protein VGN03_14660 [Steroidobacteraceae bacterium]|jgi:hypothetical protein
MSRTTAERSNQSPGVARYQRFSSHSALLAAVVRALGLVMQRVLEL